MDSKSDKLVRWRHAAIMPPCNCQALSSAGRPAHRNKSEGGFTDIVGFTALMGKDEDRAFEVLRRNREMHTKLINQFNGSLIKELGDGMLIQSFLTAKAG